MKLMGIYLNLGNDKKHIACCIGIYDKNQLNYYDTYVFTQKLKDRFAINRGY